jgi:hypothetical protein
MPDGRGGREGARWPWRWDMFLRQKSYRCHVGMALTKGNDSLVEPFRAILPNVDVIRRSNTFEHVLNREPNRTERELMVRFAVRPHPRTQPRFRFTVHQNPAEPDLNRTSEALVGVVVR